MKLADKVDSDCELPFKADRVQDLLDVMVDHMRRTSEIIAAAEDAADMRRRLGAAALEMDAASECSGQTRCAQPSP